MAIDNPAKQVVFFALGFETTTPSTAVALVRARELAVRNFTSSATTSRSSRRCGRSSTCRNAAALAGRA
jgi:hydrogenase expression/formation protein HypD